MKCVIQRVSSCSVKVEGRIVGSIGLGALVLLGIHREDEISQIAPLIQRLIHLRFFSDQQDKTNLSLIDTKGELLIVSQFTLYANCKSGRRPSFTEAASGDRAKALYEAFVSEARRYITKVETGIFAEKMQVELINDGPFTLILEDR